jgi:hypothetical protein
MEEEYVQRLVRVRERWLMVQVVQVATLRRVSLVVWTQAIISVGYQTEF